MTRIINDLSVDDIRKVFGQFDRYAKRIEDFLKVGITLRDGDVRVSGEEIGIERAERVIRTLAGAEEVDWQKVDYILSLSGKDDISLLDSISDKDIICHTVQGKPIKPKTLGQKCYTERQLDLQERNDALELATGFYLPLRQ